MKLDAKDITLFKTALDTAMAKWREDAAAMMTEHPRIARQFRQQAEHAGNLRDLLELADTITLDGVST